MTLNFVQGDTAPAITAQITRDSDSEPLDLSGCVVRFQMRKPDDRRFTVNATAIVTDAAEGRVSYGWATNDLAVPGDYAVQWEITFGDSRIQTTAICLINVRRQ